MHKGYFGPVGAQIHYRALAPDLEAGAGAGAEASAGAGVGTENPPLICLPASPHSGLSFEMVMPLLNAQRRVVAVDYPGFGGSDPLNADSLESVDGVDGEASIAQFAQSLFSVIETFGRVDLLGFHTGNLVAAELALQYPDNIASIVMVDVPFFDAQTREKYDTIIGQPPALPQTIGDLESSFEKNITARVESVGHTRAYAIWVESLRAGTQGNSAFHAAFTYDAARAFTALKRPINIIATQSSLLEPSRAAAKVLPNASLVEDLSITASVFEQGAKPIARAILAAL